MFYQKMLAESQRLEAEIEATKESEKRLKNVQGFGQESEKKLKNVQAVGQESEKRLKNVQAVGHKS